MLSIWKFSVRRLGTQHQHPKPKTLLAGAERGRQEEPPSPYPGWWQVGLRRIGAVNSQGLGFRV